MMKTNYFSHYLCFYSLFVVFLSACSTSSEAPLTATYSSISSKVFSNSCAKSGCHNGESQAGTLDLSGSKSFNSIIEVTSSSNESLLIIKPFSANESLLFQVIRDANAAPASDPHSQNLLPLETINIIEKWINLGSVIPNLISIQKQVFSKKCTTCHSGNNPPAGLNLAENSYINLVGKTRAFDSEILISAGDIKNSFLIDKLEDNNLGGSRGSRMPVGTDALEPEVINTIKEWISEGAKPE